MVLNNEFKYFKKIIENGNGSVIANRDNVAFSLKQEQWPLVSIQ
jgi:hypothetical protein